MRKASFNQISVLLVALIALLVGCVTTLDMTLAQSGRTTTAARRSLVIPVIATRRYTVRPTITLSCLLMRSIRVSK